MKKYSIYKDECKEWINKDDSAKTREKYRTHFTEAYFEINGDNELNKKHVGSMVDNNADQPHVEESHMVDDLIILPTLLHQTQPTLPN